MAKKSEKSPKYNLSVGSRKSSAEFGYSSNLASVLKNALAPLVFGQYGNALHKRLQKCITAAIARGLAAKKGNRTMAEGDVSVLKGLELNTYTPFSALTFSLVLRAAIFPETNTLRIEMPAIRPDCFRWPERAQAAYLNVRCLVVDVKHRMVVGSYTLEPVTIAEAGTGSPPRRATVKTTDLEDRMVLVATGVSFFRTDSEGEEGLISHNRKYYAAQLVEAAYVKDGKVVVFNYNDKKPDPVMPSSESEVLTIKWDNDD